MTASNPVWYVFVHESQYGPVTLEQVRQWVGEGRVQADDLVWDFAGEHWLPARQLPELRDLFGDTAADTRQAVPDAAELAGTRVYFASYRESSSTRRYIRLPACLPLTYQEINPFDNTLVSRPATAVIENISPGGLAFDLVGRTIREKTRLRLEIRLPQRAQPVVIIGEVTRTVAYPQQRSLIAVGFRETDSAGQEALFTYLRGLLAAHPPLTGG